VSSWAGEIAAVTGARGSIGVAITAHLAGLGAAVAGGDLPGPDDGVAPLDVTDPASIDAWLDDTEARLGPPTIGVICAGISRDGRLIDTSDRDWTDVIDVNLTGAFYTARALIRRMVKQRIRGRIVFIGSWAAHAPHPHIGAYSAAKAGLRALAQTLALDHAEDGILVNEVAPGIVDAGLSRALFRRDAALEQRTRAAIPSGLILQPEDVARDVAFLVSPENRHTTGAVLVTDGGLSLASKMNPGRRA
jgi:NAD(P)-dependent dehydrogenase (short-subunit alcohol dehydrogenase family)